MTPRLAPAVLFAVVLVVAILTVTPWPVGAFQDDAIYTVLARSLASGEGYRLTNLPGAPNATHYPPGYPLVLAALWKMWPNFPGNIVLFKFANAVFLAFAAVGTMIFARRRLGWDVIPSMAVGVVGTLSIVVLLITGVVLSEPLFMALLLPTLLLAESSAETPGARRALTAGLALGWLALVRTIGVVGIPAALAVLVFRRRWRDAGVLLAGAAVFLVPWQMWVAAHQHEVAPVLQGKYGAYGSWVAQGYREGGFTLVREVVVANLQSLDGMLSYVFMPVQAAFPRGVALIVLAALLVIGLWRLSKVAPVGVGFVLFYMGITIIWPFEPNRFVLAIWPLVCVSVASGVAGVWQWRPIGTGLRAVRWGALGATAILIVGFSAYNLTGFRRQWWASVQRDAGVRAKPVAEWVARHTRSTDIVATDDDLIIHLYTGRPAVPTSTFLPRERTRPLTPAEDAEALRAILATYKPRFFVSTSKLGIQSATTLSELSPPLLRRVASTSNALIFERLEP